MKNAHSISNRLIVSILLSLLWGIFSVAGCTIKGGGDDNDSGPDSDSDSDSSTTDDTGYEGDGVTLHAIFVDVWQGDSAVFLFPDGSVVVVDGGDNGYGNTDVLPVLEEYGVDKIDVVILTHPHADHCGGLDEVLRALPVEQVWENGETSGSSTYGRFAEARDESGAEKIVPPVGTTRSFGGVTLEVLAAASGYDNENNDSIVATLSYGDVRIFLAGDAEFEEQDDVLDAHAPAKLRADILKVPHHGSYKFADAFPGTVDPDYAVFSCGDGNDYGHPHDESLAAYIGLGSHICRTDVSGNISFEIDGSSIESSCY